LGKQKRTIKPHSGDIFKTKAKKENLSLNVCPLILINKDDKGKLVRESRTKAGI
jgi:hypothetical protein